MRKANHSVILLLFLSFCAIGPGGPPHARVNAAPNSLCENSPEDGGSAASLCGKPATFRGAAEQDFIFLKPAGTGVALPVRVCVKTVFLGGFGAPCAERLSLSGWGVLTRSQAKCETFSDPKTGGKSLLYFPAGFLIPAATKELEKRCRIRVEHLPAVIEKPGGIDV